MVQQVFVSEEITDNNAHASTYFKLSSNTGQPSHIAFQIGNVESSAVDANTFQVLLYVSPNFAIDGESSAVWIPVPQSIFLPVYLFLGLNGQGYGAIDSGNEYFGLQEMFGNFPYCKLVAQRGQIDGGGTNTVTINAWVL